MKRVLVTIGLLLTAGVAARAEEPTRQASSMAADGLARFKRAFRVTHRFAPPLRGGFVDVAGDLFGLDSGAQIELECRFGIVSATTMGRTRAVAREQDWYLGLNISRKF